MPLVGVIMGSSSDEATVNETVQVLEELGVDYEVRVMSAHRAPDRVREYATTARERGIEVFIAAAGGAAALPGVLASWSTLPVIGVPLASSELKGLDALMAVAQDGGSAWLAFMAVLGILVIHLIEAWILNPKILGDMLHLHPVMVLAILAVGEHFFGVWGLLLGVPVIVYILRFVILDEGIPGIIDPIRPEDLLKAAAADLGEDERAAQGAGADGE